MGTRLASLFSGLLLLPFVAACAGRIQDRTPYYEGTPPSFTGISQVREVGNVGGQEITLQGSGFGQDANKLVVYFGTLNAEILSVSDTEIRVRTPQGPISGGAVDVQIATEGGQALGRGAYTYEVDERLAGEVAYIVATNYWNSCYGGRADPLGAGCGAVSYIGDTGTEVVAEFFDFVFPRVHTQYLGFWGGTDVARDWKVQVPGQVAFAQNVDDLRVQLGSTPGDLFLRNRAWPNRNDFAPDLRGLGTWHYGGGEGDPPVTLFGDTTLLDDSYPSRGRTYNLQYLPICPEPVYQETGYDYVSEWPIGRPFFASEEDVTALEEDSPYDESYLLQDALEVELTFLAAGIDGFGIKLPEPIQVLASQGFAAPEAYSLSTQATCYDDDGDGQSLLDEVAWQFRWLPTEAAVSSGAGVRSVRTYVRLTMTVFTISWLGGESYPVRVSYEVDETDESHRCSDDPAYLCIDVPASVMYQIPSVKSAFWPADRGVGQGSSVWAFGDPQAVGEGYFIVTTDRITEYVLNTSQPLGGDTVFAYVTGDFGFLDWSNPIQRSGCADCLDGDGDGWVDGDDADCFGGASEEDGSGDALYTCSDSVDNDGDGDIDAADEDCESGHDGETNCSDGEDNDGDGWTDGLDAECIADPQLGFEDGVVLAGWTCSDGVDNDADGWVDGADPGCPDGISAEADGFAGTACNDGVDNDGHGDVDSADLYCSSRGAKETEEQPTFADLCINAIDDDGDGFIDANDPGCEYSPYWREEPTNEEPASHPECGDGVDNDADGRVDAEDAGCWVASQGFQPDGFRGSEASTEPCDDGADNDGDGWADRADPDCEPGVSGAELGLGSAGCNNGVDDDLDTLTDAEDPDCVDAAASEKG